MHPLGHMQPSRPICVALHPTFKIFSLPLDVDCKVSLKQQMKFIELQFSEDLKYKLLATSLISI